MPHFIKTGCRVNVIPRGIMVFSLREILNEHGKITGTVETVVSGAPAFADAPYRVKLDHRDDRYRWCSLDELTIKTP